LLNNDLKSVCRARASHKFDGQSIDDQGEEAVRRAMLMRWDNTLC
jgi:hypothetical protein